MKLTFLWLSLSVLLLSSSLSHSQDVEPLDPLLLSHQSLSYAVRSALIESRELAEESQRISENMIQDLENYTSELLDEVSMLREHLRNTTDSFLTLLQTIEELNENSIRLEERLKVRNTILLWMGILFLINLGAKVVMFILYKKGVKVPRVLDIII